ncbi:DUF4240 domain-containing protein [Muricauda sp. SCSIO 64092]|uniref:DUF4240 domain-containing protein n=1 Tax=Allomuricauda sp. SCSIO 64092 TaxID=2908842 RepID=UPI001FF1B67B|nr:DUF4240 domain-containing protein [Muricauda sp. SCSIO 64092]UOY05024.1 DUF4240 domain-containing protein [Muricauda sp. SCSIO 64092]
MEQEKDIVCCPEMDENIFWRIIKNSQAQTSEVNRQFDRLGDILRGLSPLQIVGFRLTMDRLFKKLGDAYLYWNPDELPEDQRSSADDIKYLIISMGEFKYFEIRINPDKLYHPYYKDTWALESVYLYGKLDCSSEIFQEKTGEDLDKFIETYHRFEELEQNEQQDHDQEMEQ